jgi:hypothetical protein
MFAGHPPDVTIEVCRVNGKMLSGLQPLAEPNLKINRLMGVDPCSAQSVCPLYARNAKNKARILTGRVGCRAAC